MSEYWRWYNGFAGTLKDIKANNDQLTLVLDMKDSAPPKILADFFRKFKLGKLIWVDMRETGSHYDVKAQ